MSIFKVPKSVLNYMESLRRNFFNGFQEGDRKIAWVKWSKVLASKKFGGLRSFCIFDSQRATSFQVEVNSLKSKEFDLISHCMIRVEKGTGYKLLESSLIGRNLLKLSFPVCLLLRDIRNIESAVR
ncbi:hypothetical protein Tco_0665117 [Tanacetum coccineum]